MITDEMKQQKGLFTFYKEQEDFDNYLQSAKKLRKKQQNRKNKSKSKKKHKKSTKKKDQSPKQFAKSQTQQTKQTIDIDAKNKFLREIIQNKLRSPPVIFRKQQHLKTQSQEILSKKLRENQKKTPLTRLSRILTQQNYESSDFLAPKPNFSGRKAFEEVIAGNKVQRNFFAQNCSRMQFSFAKKGDIFDQKQQNKRLNKIWSQGMLPSLKKNRLSKALVSVSRAAQKNQDSKNKYDSQFQCNSILREHRSERKIRLKNQNKKQKKHRLTQISKVNIQQGDMQSNQKNWQKRKNTFLKKLGIKM